MHIVSPILTCYNLGVNYQGVIIFESLGDPSILQDVKILATTVEEVTEKHKTPWLTRWTLHTVGIPEKKGDEFAETLSRSFDATHDTHWFADYKNDNYHFIVFPNRVFKVDLTNPILYKEAKKYGISLGIPSYQLNFAP